MTDEGQRGHPMDAVEVLQVMRNLGAAVKAFHDELIEQGFEKEEALRLTVAWIVGTAGGKAS
jgi:hypothetical protein